MSRSAIFLLILLSSVSMAGTALPQPTSDPAPFDFDTFQLLKADGTAVAPVTVDQAADALKDYDVVVIGELHDHIANHLAELALLRAIHARAPRIALSMPSARSSLTRGRFAGAQDRAVHGNVRTRPAADG